ncbi:MAG: VCBS repeat-containing protein [Steroidobacteraceae bacterium]|nr:VCBS repeat-containing protein [Steroidobacteraceae bacterium]
MDLPDARRQSGALFLALALTAAGDAHAGIGRTAGMPSVSADGEAGYTIPLQLPPGTNGMTPALSLEYRHRVTGGFLGIGWSVGGLSQITRCRRTIAQDGPQDPVMRLMRDRFCLDGQRLVVTNGVAYGAAGAEYRTEIESFARIRQVSGSSPGPQHFIVETHDGRILEYGATANSRIDWSTSTSSAYPAVVWALNRIRDRSGNVIDFEYVENTTDPGYRIANVRYNANPAAGVAASHQVAFIYESRPSNEVDITHVAGRPVRLIVRLDRIDVFHGSTLLRRYELNYQPALTATGRSRLASLQECGAGGTDCLAPTTFDWTDTTPGFGAAGAVSAAIPGSTSLPAHQLINTADVNGDGRDDLVYAAGSSTASATIRYRLGLGAGFGAEVDTGIACPNGIGMPFDYNGDGRADLLMAGPGSQWRIVPGTAAGLGAPIATGVSLPPLVMDYRGVDMNGDGLGDIAWSEPLVGAENFLEVRVRLAEPAGGFAAVPRTLYAQTPELGFEYARGGRLFGRPGARIDLDADGADDLLLDEYETMTLITIGENATTGVDGSLQGGTPLDMNGDGCADFAYKHYSGRLRIRVGLCGAYWNGTELLGPVWTGATELRVHDWNADGRDDLLLRGATNWHVAISNGDSFAAVADTGIPHEGATFAEALDADGDGLRDLVVRAGNQIRLRLRNGPRPDLLRAATDGFGVAASFTYRPLTDPAVYTRGPDAAYPEQAVQSSAHVVSGLSHSDGTGTGSFMSAGYVYEGLRRNLTGRGSLGFSSRTTTELAGGSGLRVTESWRQDYPYTGLPASTVVRQSSGKPVSETVFSWSSLTLGSGPGLRRFPYAASTTLRRREAGGMYDGVEIANLVRTVASIDAASGVVTDESTTITETASGAGSGASTTVRTLHSGLLNDTVNWCNGRPLATQVTASHTLAGGNPVTRSFSQAWDGQKCRLTQARREPGSSQWQVSIALAYDAFGNVASRSVTGAGMSPRTTTISWGPRGQLPASVTDPLQQTYTLAWNQGTGLPLAVTDPNTLTVSWTYDAFGRLAQETRPGGINTTWSREACGAGCDPRTRYRLVQRERDAAGATQRTVTLDLDQYERAFRQASGEPGGGTSVQLVDADARGRVLRQYRPFWNGGTPPGYWQHAYDALGRLTGVSLRSASGAIERQHTLRHDGLVVTHVDPLGRTSAAMRTAWGTPAQVSDPAGGMTRYEYDAFGGLLRVRDALGNLAASASYNASGMLVTQTEMNSGTWTYTRNALGELISLRDAKAQTIAFSYDALGRPLSRVAPDGTSTLTWGTSAASRNIGRLTSLAGPGYSESFLYDAVGRPSQRTITAGETFRYDYGYDSFGRPATLTYPATADGSRFRIGFAYDAGRLSRIFDPGAPATEYWRLGAMDAAGNVVDETLGASVRVISGFDPVTGAMDYRRATAGPAVIQDLAYAWDANDNLTRRRDIARGIVEDFRYDALDRLEESRRNGAVNLGVSYDLIGNIRWKSDVCTGTTPCYVYDGTRRHAATSIASQPYGYDANGNLTNRAGSAIAWTSDNLPSSIAGTGGNSSQFWYGPGGNRWKQQASYAGTSETTTYAGGLMEKVVRGGTTTWRHYVPAPTGIAAVHLKQANGGAPATRYLTHDHLGSTDRILNEAGQILVSESFAPFGHRRGADWTGTPSPAELATIGAITRDGFTGHEHLDNLGLIHMNGRAYDPRLGRFLSADPYVTAPFNGQSLNRYSYVWNNPLSLIDPSGFDPQVPCASFTPGTCVEVTVIGAKEASQPNYGQVNVVGPSWVDYMRMMLGPGGGGGLAQAVSASERDPCGQDSSGMSCGAPSPQVTQPSSIVQTVSSQAGPALGPRSGLDALQGGAARLGNLLFSASPLTWLFGADPNFEWFHVPDSAAGRAGATVGNVGFLAGGVVGIVRGGGARLAAARIPTAGGAIRQFRQPAEQIYYRVYSENAVGRWLTAIRPRSSAWAQEALSLPSGNFATFVQEVRVPAGTLLERSRALAVPEWNRVRGGAEQFRLLEEIPLRNFGPGVPLP